MTEAAVTNYSPVKEALLKSVFLGEKSEKIKLINSAWATASEKIFRTILPTMWHNTTTARSGVDALVIAGATTAIDGIYLRTILDHSSRLIDNGMSEGTALLIGAALIFTRNLVVNGGLEFARYKSLQHQQKQT